jgi:UDP-N-acetylglucosamine--N-acetylmuramyl-(pentapeptide) pyrophosphoryl-undecaprenol N-acetylglucosamine transferase
VKHLLCTGGGTAGHVIPAIPIMERALERGIRVSFIGSRTGLEEGLLAGLPVQYHGIASGKLRRYLSAENLADVFRVAAGIWQAFWLVRRLRPDVVFSKGGFVSFPVVFAAWLLRIPVVAHESDLSPGLANRLSLPFVRTLAVTFPVTEAHDFRGRTVIAGTPLRAALLEGDPVRGRALLDAPADRPVLLVTGGSLGAEPLNRAVVEALPRLLEQFVVVHVCGAGKMPDLRAPGYHPYEYVRDEWGELLAAADLVVSRAGANTLFELLALRKPTLLVPLSRRASRGDQIENAAWARAAGVARVLDDESLSGDRLVDAVRETWSARDDLRAALTGFTVPDAASVLFEELERVAGERRN